MLQDEKKFRIFENKIFRKIIDIKCDEEKDEWRKLHNVELRRIILINYTIVRILLTS